MATQRMGQPVREFRFLGEDEVGELLQVLLVGADEAGDRWMVEHWEQFDENEIEHIFEEIFAIFRRMLEPAAG